MTILIRDGAASRRNILKWAAGFHEHDKVNDECCPDFSCCVPSMFETDAQKRWAWAWKLIGKEQSR